MLFVYFLLVHIVLLLPAYGFLRKYKILNDASLLQLIVSYIATIIVFAIMGFLLYVANVPEIVLRVGLWVTIITGVLFFVQQKAWRPLLQHRFVLSLLFVMSLLPTIIIGLGVNSSNNTFIPDPEYKKGNNYTVLSVKVLNFAHTPANDNYIPYRQAQFFVNHSDPEKDSFINEWGVSFFQRTLLMGSVVSSFFTLLDDNPPIAYTWDGSSLDPDVTYAKFQIIAHVLNALFILPGFLLLKTLFNKKTALLSCLLLCASHFYLYNAIFSWPKSFTAFFVLTSLIFLLGERKYHIAIAGVIAGIGYFVHDLAIVFIATSFVFLLLKKQFKPALIYLATATPFPIIWGFISSVLYHRPSTFIYYPFSLDGLPQEATKSKLIPTFFSTNPLHIIRLKIDGALWLMSPYQLIFEAHQNFLNRLWAVGIYTIPGSLGIGLMALAPYSLLKKWKMIKWEIWFFALFPVLVILFLFGDPKVLGSLHFSEPIIVLIVGGIVHATLQLKKLYARLLLSAFVVNFAYFVFFVFYSYNFGTLLHTPSNYLSIVALVCIAVYIMIVFFGLITNKNSSVRKFVGA